MDPQYPSTGRDRNTARQFAPKLATECAPLSRSKASTLLGGGDGENPCRELVRSSLWWRSDQRLWRRGASSPGVANFAKSIPFSGGLSAAQEMGVDVPGELSNCARRTGPLPIFCLSGSAPSVGTLCRVVAVYRNNRRTAGRGPRLVGPAAGLRYSSPVGQRATCWSCVVGS